MKTYKITILLILFLGMLAGCNSYYDPNLDPNEFIGNPSFELSTEKIEIDLEAYNTSIDVETNAKWWTIKSDAEWVKVTSDTLRDVEKVDVAIMKNETTDTRTAILTLKSGTIGPKKTITIKQTGLPSNVSVSDTSVKTTGYGGTYEVDITSNATWTVKIEKETLPNDDWISVTPLKGTGNGKIAIAVSKNVKDDVDYLKAKIIVSVADESKEIIVEQLGNSSCDAPDNDIVIYFDNFFPCPSSPVGSTWTLTDPRDGQTYRVRLMADGNYWTIDDIKFSGDTGAQKGNLNTFNGNGHETKGFFFPNYFGDVTDKRIHSYTPTNRGYFYSWQTVIQSIYSRNAGNYSTNVVLDPEYQGLAPNGWQVPAIEHYENLYAKIGYQGMIDDWEAVLGGDINYDASSNWGVNSYAKYWTITQKNRDKSLPGSAVMNTILIWKVDKASLTGSRGETPRNYGCTLRFLKKTK